MSIVLLAMSFVVFYTNISIIVSKTTSLISPLKGGQLRAKKDGQFGVKMYGQHSAESGDLFMRNFQILL
jgi:hypothetical protein